MSEAETPTTPSAHRRPIDLVSATSLVAASMIGAGVFTTSGYSLASLGSPVWVMVAWGIASVIAISGAVCYAALAKYFTESGGEYLFLSRALHPIAGMMAGWVSLLAGFTGAIAFAATTFAEYLEPLLPLTQSGEDSIVVQAIAIGVIIVSTILHLVGVKPGARAQDVVVVLKFVLIAAFVAVAMSAVGRTGLQESTSVAGGDSPLAMRLATQLMWISLSFSGFNAAVYVAGEVVDPAKNVRRAILGGTLLVTFAYLVLNAIFVFAAPAEAIAGQAQVATVAAGSIGGESFELFVRGVILLCLFTSVSAQIMAGPRVYAKMAEDGFLPRKLFLSGWDSEAGKPPINAIVIQSILAMVVVCIAGLNDLLGYLGFTLSVSAALTASLLFFVNKPFFKSPLGYIAPVVFVGGTLLTASISAYHKPTQAIVGVVTILFGACLYPWYSGRHAGTS